MHSQEHEELCVVCETLLATLRLSESDGTARLRDDFTVAFTGYLKAEDGEEDEELPMAE